MDIGQFAKGLTFNVTAEVNCWQNKSLHSVVFPSASEINVCEIKIVCCLPSVVCCLPAVVCCLPSVVCCLPTVVCCLPSVVCCLPSVVCCLPSETVTLQLSPPPCPSVLERGQGRCVGQHDRPPPTLQTSCQPCNTHPPAWSIPAVC
jgi:hypothetical protein